MPPNSNAGVCKLCQQTADLRKSHVISDMAYNEVINPASHPRMVVVRDVKGRISDKTQQTGFWERLLCERCEKQFSKYEKYAAEHLLNAPLPEVKNISDLVFTLHGLNYASLKLFLLSILWRSSIAKGDFFRGINLGPHEARLRQMLDSEDPGEPDEYGCVITPFLPEPNLEVSQILSQPISTRGDGHNGCLFSFRGFAFNFYISRHALLPAVRKSFLTKGGELIMVRARIGDYAPLRDLWNRCVSAIHREARK